MVALYQIQEPDEKERELQKQEPVLGIDLGTTYSLVGAVMEDKVRFFAEDKDSSAAHDTGVDEEGHPHTHSFKIPSVVYRTDNGEILAGKAALPYLDRGAIISAKRKVGMHEKSLYANGMDAIEVSAQILSHLKKIAENNLGEEASKCVITVPAYFDEQARSATKIAARAAGLEVIRMLNEPTAAALAYGMAGKNKGVIAVYDFGGGTFDITILKLHMGVYQVIATAGDNILGGDDVDLLLLKLLKSKELHNSHQYTLSDVRAIKEHLTSHSDFRDESDNIIVTRDEFEEAIATLVERTIALLEQAIADSGYAASDIEDILLVGGSSRIPLISKILKRKFGKDPVAQLDPDLVVARGAILQAQALARPSDSDNILLDVIPLSLGLEVANGSVEKLLHRNIAIPTSVSKTFTTQVDGQDGLSINIVQGESESVQDCRSLASFELKGIPPMPAGEARIEITFTIDVDGLLSVVARETISGIEQIIEVIPSYGLDEEAIRNLILKINKNDKSDK